MWEEEARKIISEIAAALRGRSPDCRNMIPTVRDLVKIVARRNIGRPGDNLQMMDQKAAEIRPAVESLEAALLVDEADKALKHAELALRVLDDQRTD
jgi:hypothetical protein